MEIERGMRGKGKKAKGIFWVFDLNLSRQAAKPPANHGCMMQLINVTHTVVALVGRKYGTVP